MTICAEQPSTYRGLNFSQQASGPRTIADAISQHVRERAKTLCSLADDVQRTRNEVERETLSTRIGHDQRVLTGIRQAAGTLVESGLADVTGEAAWIAAQIALANDRDRYAGARATIDRQAHMAMTPSEKRGALHLRDHQRGHDVVAVALHRAIEKSQRT